VSYNFRNFDDPDGFYDWYKFTGHENQAFVCDIYGSTHASRTITNFLYLDGSARGIKTNIPWNEYIVPLTPVWSAADSAY
jgi:prepilin-type processing-associated H-X9-DG protein